MIGFFTIVILTIFILGAFCGSLITAAWYKHQIRLAPHRKDWPTFKGGDSRYEDNYTKQ